MSAFEDERRRFELPLLEDANSVQMALMKVMQMLGSGRLDHKTAGLMLYALQTASCNLRNLSLEHVVIDRDDIHRTCIGGPQWLEEDFENEEGQGEEEEASAEDEGEEDESEEEAEEVAEEVADGEELAKIRPRRAVTEGRVSIEEARKQVQGVIYDWIGETQAGDCSNPG